MDSSEFNRLTPEERALIWKARAGQLPQAVQAAPARRGKHCSTCGAAGSGTAPGSILIEIALWLLFCAPGLIYTLWRMTAHKVCRQCGGRIIKG